VDLVLLIKELGGETDLETIAEAAWKRGMPPPVATRRLMRLVEMGVVEVVCYVGVRYRVR